MYKVTNNTKEDQIYVTRAGARLVLKPSDSFYEYETPKAHFVRVLSVEEVSEINQKSIEKPIDVPKIKTVTYQKTKEVIKNGT